MFPSPPINAEAVKGENDSKAQIALTNAILAEKEAEAAQRSQVAKQHAEAEIQKARALAQTQLLEAEQIVPQEIKKKKIQIEAEAEAQSKVLIARGEAEAILAIKQAEAEGIQKLLDAKAKGYKQLVEACGDDAKSASTMLLIEKLEEIVKTANRSDQEYQDRQDHRLGQRQWRRSDKGSSTSNFISQFVKSLPALHDIASLAGLEIPLPRKNDPRPTA